MKRFGKRTFGIILGVLAVTALAGCDECEFEAITTGSLPEGTVGTPYSTGISTQQNCNVTYSEFILVSGDIPPGISVDDDGSIQGTPTAEGLYTFTIRVEICFTGSNPDEVEDCHQKAKGFSLLVNPAPVP